MPKSKDDKEDNPLSFLDRLLDDERDSNLHFGDIRFWRHLEHIDTQRIYHTKSLEYRTVKLMFCEAMFYAVFLLFLTGFIVFQRSTNLYDSRRQELDYWAGCHYTVNDRSCEIDGIKDIAGLFDWLCGSFVPRAFTDRTLYPSIVSSTSIFRLQSGTMLWTPRYVGDTHTSVIIGSIRMRQLRVQYNKGCQILPDFKDIQSDCFAPFDADVQSTFSWAPTWTPSHLTPYYAHYKANETNQATTHGRHGVYPGDGFFIDMPLNQSGAATRLRELQEWQWLDGRTRAFIIEFNTLNPNVNIFVNSRILFEFPATGGMTAKQEAFPFRALMLSLPLMATDDFTGTFLFFVCTSAMHLMLFLYITFLVYKNGLQFFKYFWSICDCCILVMFIILVATYIAIFTEAAGEPNFLPDVIADPEMFFPAGHLVPKLEFSASIMAILGLLSWLKIIKYFSLVHIFMPFVRVLERCILNLLMFACLLFVVLFGFAVALHTSYGDESNLFSTIVGSFFAVMVMPGGGVDLEPIFMYNDVLGPLLIFSYIVVILLLLLNTFMAICVDTYTVVTFEIGEVTEGMGHSAPYIFMRTYISSLKGVKLVGKETEHDMGDPDEQIVALSSLPEEVAGRYMQKKKRMEAILNEAEEEVEQLRLDKLRAQGVIAATGVDKSTLKSRLGGSNGQLALQDQPRMQALEDNNPSPPPRPPDFPPPPAGFAPTEAELHSVMVQRVQLQRMLDDDDVLRDICGTTRAVDVVRRFRVDQSGGDPFEAVVQLQAAVTKKLKQLQHSSLSFNEIETLKTVSTELHSALTESQKEWRAELLTVLQMASLLSVALKDLTKEMEQVQLNHNSLAMRAGPPR